MGHHLEQKSTMDSVYQDVIELLSRHDLIRFTLIGFKLKSELTERGPESTKILTPFLENALAGQYPTYEDITSDRCKLGGEICHNLGNINSVYAGFFKTYREETDCDISESSFRRFEKWYEHRNAERRKRLGG